MSQLQSRFNLSRFSKNNRVETCVADIGTRSIDASSACACIDWWSLYVNETWPHIQCGDSTGCTAVHNKRVSFNAKLFPFRFLSLLYKTRNYKPYLSITCTNVQQRNSNHVFTRFLNDLIATCVIGEAAIGNRILRRMMNNDLKPEGASCSKNTLPL